MKAVGYTFFLVVSFSLQVTKLSHGIIQILWKVEEKPRTGLPLCIIKRATGIFNLVLAYFLPLNPIS